MKKLLLLSLMAIAIQSQAQNVGIGNPAPAEKLDVTGNINVTGTIKANGTDGTAGQVLQNNGNGTIGWSDATSSLYLKYPNSTSFNGSISTLPNTAVNYTFTVPATITKIWVEAWGGGSAGTNLPATITNTTASKGGDAGNYISAILSVVPSEMLSVYVGNGGANTTGTGSAIYRNATSVEILSVGGGGQDFLFYLPVDPITTNFIGLLSFVRGESGHVSTESYSQTSATTFVRTIVGGDGGSAFPNQKGSSGVTVTYNLATNTMLSNLGIYSGNGASPGGGGGVGYLTLSQGGLGMVIIHW